MTAPVQSVSQIFSGVSSATLAFSGVPSQAIPSRFWWLGGDTPSVTTTETLAVPADANGTWVAAKNVTSFVDVPNQIAGGASGFIQQVSNAATHSTTVLPPSGRAGNLFALVTMQEWPAATLDQTQVNTNSSAGSITSMNSGATASLAATNDFAIGCVCAVAGTGLTNAGISDPANGYTASLGVSQNDSATVGAEVSYLSSAGSTAAQTATWSCTADSSMTNYQAIILTLTPSGGGGLDDDGDWPMSSSQRELKENRYRWPVSKDFKLALSWDMRARAAFEDCLLNLHNESWLRLRLSTIGTVL